MLSCHPTLIAFSLLRPIRQAQKSQTASCDLDNVTVGSPAFRSGSVTFRPCLPAGLALFIVIFLLFFS